MLEPNLRRVLAGYGAKAKIPALWLYSENDNTGKDNPHQWSRVSRRRARGPTSCSCLVYAKTPQHFEPHPTRETRGGKVLAESASRKQRDSLEIPPRQRVAMCSPRAARSLDRDEGASPPPCSETRSVDAKRFFQRWLRQLRSRPTRGDRAHAAGTEDVRRRESVVRAVVFEETRYAAAFRISRDFAPESAVAARFREVAVYACPHSRRRLRCRARSMTRAHRATPDRDDAEHAANAERTCACAAGPSRDDGVA